MQPNAPNFMILGTAKSGTTSLQAILAQHPQVFMSSPKATGFFNHADKFARGIDWYLDTFFTGAEKFPVRGEATPSYFAHGAPVAHRIHASLDVKALKFIVIFRNPVDRAYSHYWYNYNKKSVETLGFEQALEMEARRICESDGFSKRNSLSLAYFRNGLYKQQAMEYFTYFSRDQFLFLLFDDLWSDQFSLTVSKITDFLDLERVPLVCQKRNEAVGTSRKQAAILLSKAPILKRILKPIPEPIKLLINRLMRKPTRYPVMRSETRHMLVQKYSPSILELQDMLGRDLTHWLKES